MEILESLLTINGKDIYKEYRAFLAEDKSGGHDNYNALLQVPTMKAYTAVTFREQNGENLPDSLPAPHYEARDVTLPIRHLGRHPGRVVHPLHRLHQLPEKRMAGVCPTRTGYPIPHVFQECHLARHVLPAYSRRQSVRQDETEVQRTKPLSGY